MFRSGAPKEPKPPASTSPKGEPIRATKVVEPRESMIQRPLHVLVIFGRIGEGPGAGVGRRNPGEEAAATGEDPCSAMKIDPEMISRTEPEKAIAPEALIAGVSNEAKVVLVEYPPFAAAPVQVTALVVAAKLNEAVPSTKIRQRAKRFMNMKYL